MKWFILLRFNFLGRILESPKIRRYLFKSMSQFNYSVQLQFLPPYIPTQTEQNDAELYSTNVQHYMSTHSQILAGTKQYKDYLYLKKT